MRGNMTTRGLAIVLLGLAVVGCSQGNGDSQGVAQQMTHEETVARGEYLVNLGGCNDCHTPKVMTAMGPVPDTMKLLSGHQASDPIPEYPADFLATSGWMAATNPSMTAWAGPWGISFSANLTPDQVTGSGAWTDDAFIGAMRSGNHLGMGRPILPPMPWQPIGALPDADLKAIFAYLQSIPAVKNEVPQPIPPPAMGEHAQTNDVHQ